MNEVARIAALCRSVDRPILMSSALARSVAEDRRRFASVGRFSLRGVGNPQELYALRWMRRVRGAAGRSFALRPRLDANLVSEVAPGSLLENIERKEKPHAITCPLRVLEQTGDVRERRDGAECFENQSGGATPRSSPHLPEGQIRFALSSSPPPSAFSLARKRQ
jgi:hypothetical protein